MFGWIAMLIAAALRDAAYRTKPNRLATVFAAYRLPLHTMVGDLHSAVLTRHRSNIYLDVKKDQRAVTALEYGLIAGVIATVVVLGFSTYGTHLKNAFTSLVV